MLNGEDVRNQLLEAGKLKLKAFQEKQRLNKQRAALSDKSAARVASLTEQTVKSSFSEPQPTQSNASATQTALEPLPTANLPLPTANLTLSSGLLTSQAATILRTASQSVAEEIRRATLPPSLDDVRSLSAPAELVSDVQLTPTAVSTLPVLSTTTSAQSQSAVPSGQVLSFPQLKPTTIQKPEQSTTALTTQPTTTDLLFESLAPRQQSRPNVSIGSEIIASMTAVSPHSTQQEISNISETYTIQNELTRLRQENDDLRKELAAQRQTVRQLEVNLQNNQRETGLQRTNLQTAQNFAKSTSDQLAIERKQWQDEKVQLDNKCLGLKTENEALMSEITRMTASQRIAKQSFETEIELLKANIADQKRRFDELTTKSEAQEAQWRTQEQVYKDALQERAQAEERLKKMVDQLNQDLKANSSLQERFQADQERVKAQDQHQHEQAIATIRSERDEALQRLEEKQREAETEREVHQFNLRQAQQQVAVLQAQIDVLTTAPPSSSSSSNDQWPQRLAELHENTQKSLREQERVFIARQQAMETEHVAQMQRLRSRNEQLEQTMSQQMAALHASLDGLVEQKRKLEDKLLAAKAQHEHISKAMAEKSQQLNAVAAQLDALQSSSVQEREAHKALQERFQSTQKQLEMAERRLQLADTDVSLHQEQTKRQLASLLEENEGLKKQRDQLQTDRLRLESLLESLQTTAQGLKDQLRVASSENAERLLRINEQREDLVKRQQWIIDTEKQLESLKEQLHAKEIELIKQETAHKNQQRQFDEREQQLHDAYQQRTTQLQSRETALQKKEAMMEQEIQHLTELERHRQTMQHQLAEQELRLGTIRQQLEAKESEMTRERHELQRLRLSIQTEKELWMMSSPAASPPGRTISSPIISYDQNELLSMLEKDERELSRLKSHVASLERKNFELLTTVLRLNQANRTLTEMLSMKTPSEHSHHVHHSKKEHGQSHKLREPALQTKSSSRSRQTFEQDEERLGVLLRKLTGKQ